MNVKCCSSEDLRRRWQDDSAAQATSPWEQPLPTRDIGSAVADTISADDETTAAIETPDRLPSQGEILAMRYRSLTETDHQDETLDGEQGYASAGNNKRGPHGDALEPYLSLLGPAEQPDELGRLGGYRVLEVIGFGGMGVVYRAEDPRLNRQVALKVMRPTGAIGQTAKERFMREAQAAAAISHDSVITIFDVGTDRGVGFIAMQFLCGESLQQKLTREKQLDPTDAVRIAYQVATGLLAAHRNGLIHRDIKPDNIWLDQETNRAKILDFGLARSHDADAELTQEGMVMGTPKYMSPEQARAEAVDHRCDLFSLGSVLYHMLSGLAPFDGGNLVATLIKVSQAEFKPIEQVCAGLEPRLAGLVNRLLSRDPDERPQSALKVMQVLTEIQNELRVEF